MSEIWIRDVATPFRPGHIQLTTPVWSWPAKAVAPPLVRRHGISPAIVAELAALSDSFRRDPADRILVATVRVFGAPLLTRDRRIIDAALVRTLP